MSSIFYFIVGLGLLIFIHELGHFLVAKWSGIRVERFSLGFGPRILKYQKGETEYCISALPLGGYVKMSGQEDFGEEEIVALDDPKAFNTKPLKNRLAVVLAGPAMNLLLPFLLMPMVFLIGRNELKVYQLTPTVLGVLPDSPAAASGIQIGDKVVSINGKPVANWNEAMRQLAKKTGTAFEIEFAGSSGTYRKTLESKEINKGAGGALGIEPRFFVDMDPVVGEVRPDSPAMAAGLKAKDRIVSINGVPIENWMAMSQQVNSAGSKELALEVLRDGQPVSLKLVPALDESSKRYVLGIEKGSNPEYYQFRRYPLGEAIVRGAEENVVLMGATLAAFKDLFTLKSDLKDMGGPIKIAQITAQAAKQGFGNFLYLLAFLSINLGILNLLPIPVLDGGHVAFMLYEAVARKPLSPKKRMVAQQVGMVLLLSLMILVTVNDIRSISIFQQWANHVKGWFG